MINDLVIWANKDFVENIYIEDYLRDNFYEDSEGEDEEDPPRNFIDDNDEIFSYQYIKNNQFRQYTESCANDLNHEVTTFTKKLYLETYKSPRGYWTSLPMGTRITRLTLKN